MRLQCQFLVLVFFLLWTTFPAIAQSTASLSPAPSVQPASNLEQEIDSEVAEAGNGKASLTEVNKELSNPISSIWALQFQQNTFWLNNLNATS